tara:strand:+ start:1649 stop:2770 length:1122 start_codon:yes stop_codon:yes gene_type:complete
MDLTTKKGRRKATRAARKGARKRKKQNSNSSTATSIKTDPRDDTNYFSSLKYGRDQGVGQDVYVDVSDAYANYKKYIISFLHVGSNSTVNFKAYVTEYSESFNCSWTPTEVYGRTDPIQNYKGTKRSISLSFDVPAASVGEAYENLGRVSKLVQMLYPNYSSNEIGAGRIIGQSPLVRVKMMNLITNERQAEFPDPLDNSQSMEDFLRQAELSTGRTSPQDLLENYQTSPIPGNGVLAAISTVTYRSDLQKTQIFEKATNTILPQAMTVTMQFDVIHEETLGWEDSNFIAPSYPHKVMLVHGDSAGAIGDDQNPADISERIRSERDNQAEEDMRRARKGALLGALGGIGRGATQMGGGNNYGQSDILAPFEGE